MSEHKGLLSGGWSMVARNKRYIFWFYVLNVVLAWFGARGLARRYRDRDFLLAIYLVWAIGLVFALIAVGFPDTA